MLPRVMLELLLPLLLVQPEPEATPAWWSALGIDAALESSVGIGTFVAHEKADDPYWASTLSLAPRWALDERSSLGLALALSYEWTALVTPCHEASGPRPAGAPARDCSDAANPSGRRGGIDDLRLRYRNTSILELAGVTLGGGASVAFPTSPESAAARNLLTAALALDLSASFGRVTPSLAASFSKFFPRGATSTLDAETLEARGGVPLGHCRAARSTDCILLAGFVADWRFGVDLGVSVEIPGVEGLSASLGLGYVYSRRFGTGGDALSSTKTDAEGRRVVDGVNDADTTTGSLGLAYEVGGGLGLALGVSSAQPARTADGKALRFPFFDFVSPANNFTVFSLGISYTL